MNKCVLVSHKKLMIMVHNTIFEHIVNKFFFVAPNILFCTIVLLAYSSVADPDLNPDPRVFGPPGSGSISQRYRSGSGFGSFYHYAKIIRKTLISAVLVTSF